MSDAHIEALVTRFSHHRGTTHRANIMEILVEILRLELEPSLTELERQAIEEQIFKDVCERLGIEACLCQRVLVLLERCCDKKGLFSCFS